MNQDRAKAAAAALKNVETLKKSLTKSNSVKAKTLPVTPAGPTKIQPSGLPEPIAGTGFVQYIMYFIGGILVLGIILMIVDRWFFPVFKRAPGGAGYISLPGSDMSDIFWTDLKTINNITIDVPPPPPSTSSSTPPPNPDPLYSPVLASQSTYTITLDVLIKDENPQSLGTNLSRIFFFLGTSLDDLDRRVTFTMDNTKNRVHINVYNTNHDVQSCVIDNVPIHKPFRIGLVKTSYAMEGYLNGLLVQTVQLQGQQVNPTIGDTIFAPQNITSPPSTVEKAAKTTVITAQAGFASAVTAAETAATAAIDAATAATTTVSTANTATAAQKATADVAAQQALKIAQQALATAQAALTTANAADTILSTGIQVMNLSLFPYAVEPNEMQARMGDLTQITTFDPKSAPASTLNSVSTWWESLWK